MSNNHYSIEEIQKAVKNTRERMQKEEDLQKNMNEEQREFRKAELEGRVYKGKK